MWLFIIVLLALIAIISWTCNQTNIIFDSINANVFTILAFISALIGAFYFWLSSKSYTDYKIKDKAVKALGNILHSSNLPIKRDKNMNSNKENSDDKREIDLSTINLQSLVANMQQMLTSPTPLIFKGWGNKRLELDVKRINLMNQYIQNIIATGQSFIQLKADALISYEKVQLLAKKELFELKSNADGAELDYKLLNDKYEHQLTKLRTEKEKMILSVEREKSEIKLLNAQASEAEAIAKQAEARAGQEEEKIETMKVATKEAKERVAMFKVATGELKFSELPQSYQIYIMTTFLNADANQLSDFDIRERIKDSIIQQAKAEADRKVADAGNARADTELKFLKNEQIKKDARL